jgi:phospholipid/cholesterol/gamma-HCH transport system ATP-binding protein
MINLNNVHKSFGGQMILKNINISIKKGETFVIIGLSGTGKTVTLRHIAGFLDPDEGDVIIDDIKMNNASSKTKQKLREKMGMVFQSGALINWLSVGDNVALPLIERTNFSRKKIDKLVDEKLSLLNLSNAKNKLPSEISGGMKKRVCLARVLVRNPEIILYDEPTSGLDPIMSSLLNELVNQMQNDYNVTSVVVTHDMKSAYEIGDKIAVLYKGEIIQCDTPENIKNSENLIVQQFINGDLEGPIDVR